MRNHWTEIEKYLEDQKIAQELIGELRDFHMRYEVENQVKERVEKPYILFYGKKILEMSIAALLQGDVLENTDDEGMNPQAEIALYKIFSLKDAENTEEVINVIDEIYNHVLDPSFEKRNGNLEKILNLPDMALANDAWQECMTDEQMEDIIQKYLSNLKKR